MTKITHESQFDFILFSILTKVGTKVGERKTVSYRTQNKIIQGEIIILKKQKWNLQ